MKTTKIINGILRKKGGRKNKRLCVHCLKSGKGDSWTCGISGHEILTASDKIRFNSPKDSKSKWMKTLSAIGWISKYPMEEKSDYSKNWNKKFALLLNTLKNK